MTHETSIYYHRPMLNYFLVTCTCGWSESTPWDIDRAWKVEKKHLRGAA